MQTLPNRTRTVLLALLVVLSAVLVVPAVSGATTDTYAQQQADDEPNDSIENATAADGRAINGEIDSKEDVDYYAISLREGSQVEISQGIGSSEITMTLLDEEGNEIASRPSQDVYVGDEDLLIANASATGTYYLKVEGNSGDEYSIGRSITEPDDYEPNDDVENAAPIESGEGVTGTIVRGDTDVFAVDADAGQRITVNATSTAPLIATLYTPDGDAIESSFVYDEDSETILEDPGALTVASTDAETSGTYYVEIEHDPSYLGNINGPYDLTVTTSGDAADGSAAENATTDESTETTTDATTTDGDVTNTDTAETSSSESDGASTTDDATADGSGTDADSDESTATATGTATTDETATDESTEATTSADGETATNAETSAAVESTTATASTEATTDASSTGTGTATSGDGDVSEDVEETAVNGPGFGIVAALVALLGAALLAARRN